MDEKIEKNKLLEKAIYTQQHWKWKLRLGGRARPPFVHSRHNCVTGFNFSRLNYQTLGDALLPGVFHFARHN
jgi:hypothetical protein